MPVLANGYAILWKVLSLSMLADLRRTLGLLVIISSLGWHPHATAQSRSAREADRRPVEVQMRNVTYHFTGSIVVQIRRLYGRLLPKNDLPVFDDKTSFTLGIESAEIAMSPASLASVLNSYIFAKDDAPLRDLSVRIDSKGRLNIKGKLHSKGDIPFEVEGRLSTTEDGKIR